MQTDVERAGTNPAARYWVVSLLRVSEHHHCFRSGCGRTGGGLQVPAAEKFCAAPIEPVPRISKQLADNTKNERLKQGSRHATRSRGGKRRAAHRQFPPAPPQRSAEEPCLPGAAQRRGPGQQ